MQPARRDRDGVRPVAATRVEPRERAEQVVRGARRDRSNHPRAAPPRPRGRGARARPRAGGLRTGSDPPRARDLPRRFGDLGEHERLTALGLRLDRPCAERGRCGGSPGAGAPWERARGRQLGLLTEGQILGDACPGTEADRPHHLEEPPSGAHLVRGAARDRVDAIPDLLLERGALSIPARSSSLPLLALAAALEIRSASGAVNQSPPIAAAADPRRIASSLLPHIPYGYARSSRLAQTSSRPPGSVRGLIHDPSAFAAFSSVTIGPACPVCFFSIRAKATSLSADPLEDHRRVLLLLVAVVLEDAPELEDPPSRRPAAGTGQGIASSSSWSETSAR